MGLLSIPFLYLYGNISAIDAYFMGSSASTESGLNVYVLARAPKSYFDLVRDRFRGRPGLTIRVCS